MSIEACVQFRPVVAPSAAMLEVWEPIRVRRAEIERQIEQLVAMAPLIGQRRSVEIVHPRAGAMNKGFTPGLSVSVNVLNPGETIRLDRDNANRVEFGLAGDGALQVASKKLAMKKWTTVSIPSMAVREYRNAGSDPLVWLSYSNQPALERLGIYYSDDRASAGECASEANPVSPELSNRYVRQNAPDHPILDDGARLRGYEFLTDIEVSEDKPLSWPWEDILPYLSRVQGDQKRLIMLMYNPATGSRNGTTSSFFATITSVPGGAPLIPPARGHRHSSFAVNYHFEGSGASIVDGQRIEWEAGDLLLSAPSWAEHAHGTTEQGASILTIQDHPFQIGLRSLIWQEDMDGPILALGSEPGQTGYVAPRIDGA